MTTADLDGLAAGLDAADDGALVDLRPFGYRGRREAEARAIGVEGLTLCPDRAVGRDTGFLGNAACGQPGTLQAGVPSRLVLTLQLARGLGAVPREEHQVLRRKIGANPQPAQRRPEIERGAPEGLPHVASGPEAMLRRRGLERGVEVLPQQARTAGRGAGPDSVRFEQDDLDARGRERRRAGTPGKPSAHNRDGYTQSPAMSRIVGAAVARKCIKEIRDRPHARGNSTLNGAPAAQHWVCFVDRDGKRRTDA